MSKITVFAATQSWVDRPEREDDDIRSTKFRVLREPFEKIKSHRFPVLLREHIFAVTV